jgi:hypothetical protein
MYVFNTMKEVARLVSGTFVSGTLQLWRKNCPFERGATPLEETRQSSIASRTQRMIRRKTPVR